jgi:hypothetical protein
VNTLARGNDLGVVIDGAEALKGILLPSALISWSCWPATAARPG